MTSEPASPSTRPLVRRTLLAVLGVAVGLGLMVVLGGGDPSRRAHEHQAPTSTPASARSETPPAEALPDRRTLVAGGYTFDGRDLLVMVDLDDDGRFTIRSVRRQDGSSRRGSGRWAFVRGAPSELRLQYERRQGEVVDPSANQDRVRFSRNAIFLRTGAGEIRLERQERVRVD